MPFAPFKRLCEYYLDYLIEDSTDSVSAFASGRSLSYVQLENPEFTSRETLSLTESENNKIRELISRQTRGNQRRTWWYGYPVLLKFITGRNNWRGGILKPLFIVSLQMQNSTISLLPTNISINKDAFKEYGYELAEIRALAEQLGLYDEGNEIGNLSLVTQKLFELSPNFQISDFAENEHFSDVSDNGEIKIYNRGIILSAEASNYTQGLEKELNFLKDVEEDKLSRCSLKSFFPDLKDSPDPKVHQETNFKLSEAIELNEQQKETVLSAFKNKLTVVTGPPGTGKSQVVASIAINAAKNGQRVLVASKNHKAVDVVEDRLNNLAERPFILRLGKYGSDNRNIQQQLIDYLNGILGIPHNYEKSNQLAKIQNELDELRANRESILSSIKKYIHFRNSLIDYSKKWQLIRNRIGNIKSKKIFLKAKAPKWSFIDKIRFSFFKDWKIIYEYYRLLKETSSRYSLEELSLKLAKIELQIRTKSKEEFILWLNEFPTRLSGEQREKIAQYVAVLRQLITLGNDTPRKVWANAYQQRDELMSSLSGFLPAWCVVNLSVRSQLPLWESFFDIVVIDEASQCDIASAIPLLFRAKRAVIIGDPNQLQHISTLRTDRSLTLMHNHNLTDLIYSNFEATVNSLYALASAKLGDKHAVMLNEHFRSHKDIISFSNTNWYGEELGIETDYERLKPKLTENHIAVEWINVEGKIEQVDRSGAFIINEVNKVVEKLIELTEENDTGVEIGIVTPFRLQANRIRKTLIDTLDAEVWRRTNLLVDTSVKFQGDERDIIIFSPVVTFNMPSGIRYYHETTSNLVNVSITRARTKLIVIGNQKACLNCGIQYIQKFANYVMNLSRGDEGNLDSGGYFESPYEEKLYNALKSKNIITMPQYVFDQYRLDLAYVSDKIKLDIEIDGVETHTDEYGDRIKQDIIRNQKLQKKGWIVIRFWNYEIRDNIENCIIRIMRILNGNIRKRMN